MSNTTLSPLQPDAMVPPQLAAVSYLARYSGHTHQVYAAQLRRWFTWCGTNRLDPLIGIQRAHVELYIHRLGETGLMASCLRRRRLNPGPARSFDLLSDKGLASPPLT